MEITIKVSPYVARIMEARYGEQKQVYKIDRTDVMYTYLQGDPLRVNKTRFRSLRKLLTENVTLKVSSKLGRRLKARRRQIFIGGYLHDVYREEMLFYVETQVHLGEPAQTAMKRYFDLNGVGEDDYALASAYEAWKRRKAYFKRRNSKKQFVPLSQSELYKTITCAPPPPMPVDPRDVVDAVVSHFSCNPAVLLDTSSIGYDIKQHRLYLYMQRILTYMLYKKSQMQGTEIAAMIHKSPRSAQVYIQKIEHEYAHYDDVKNDVDYIISILNSAT